MGAPREAGESIKKAVYTFRAAHNLSDDAWHVRALGVPGESIDVWIGLPRQPNHRTPCTIVDSGGAGAKVSDLFGTPVSRFNLTSKATVGPYWVTVNAPCLRNRSKRGAGDSYEHAKRSVEALTPREQLRLVSELAVRLSAELDPQPRSLMELEGLGREVWQGVDVEEYLRQERSSWDG